MNWVGWKQEAGETEMSEAGVLRGSGILSSLAHARGRLHKRGYARAVTKLKS